MREAREVGKNYAKMLYSLAREKDKREKVMGKGRGRSWEYILGPASKLSI